MADEDWSVRSAACAALKTASAVHADVRAALIRRLDGGHGEVRVAACRASAAVEHADARAALIRCLDDKHPGVMTAAYGALAATGKDAVVVQELTKRFFDKNRWVRETALAVLSPALSPSTQEFLLEALLWGDWSAEVWGRWF